MKIIQMKKTMAGPYGVFPVGQVRTVEDETAKTLIDAGAAILVADIVPPGTVRETATVDPVLETADAPVKARRKRAAV